MKVTIEATIGEMDHFDYPSNALVEAAEKFVSENMLIHLGDFSDDTPMQLTVAGRNGYVLTLELRDLRELEKAIMEA